MTHLLVALATALSLSTTAIPIDVTGPEGPVLRAASGAAAVFPISADIKWEGRGFLCLKTGKDCTVEINIGFNVAAEPEVYGMPSGSNVAVLNTIDGAPLPQGTPLLVGEHEFSDDEIRVRDGEPFPPGTTIYIPDQESVPDAEEGQLIYYFGG